MMDNNQMVLVSKVTPAVLAVNFNDLNKKLDEELDKYRKIIISDDEGLKDAKAMQRELI